MVYCSNCSTAVPNTARNAVSAICWQCVIELYMEKPESKQAKKSDKPPGWKFMNEYVHIDGTVYHKGIEQPELKGTLPVTVIQPRTKKKKLSEQEKLDINVKIAKLKTKLKGAKTKKAQKSLEKEIKSLTKQLK